MKYLVMIVFIPMILSGCGIQVHMLGESPEIAAPEPSPADIGPIVAPIDPVYVPMRCPVCGECIPEFVSEVCWHAKQEVCIATYSCSRTGEEFSVKRRDYEAIFWIDDWQDWPSPGPIYDPGIINADMPDSIRIKDPDNNNPTETKPTRPSKEKTARVKSYSEL